MVFERRILSKNNDGRQTTFKQKTLYRSLIYIIYVEKQDKEIARIEEIFKRVLMWSMRIGNVIICIAVVFFQRERERKS